MPGKLCQHNDARDSRAMCEGRTAAAASVLVGANPYIADTPESVAWIAGHDSWAADPAGVPRDCCADAYGGGYVAL